MKVLIAGVGNLFRGDDGWGPAMTAVLRAHDWPDDVLVTDFGIRGFDLALALTDGVDIAILLDAVQRGAAPGTLYVIEPTIVAGAPAEFDGHSLDPEAVLRSAALLGALPARVRIVGCEIATLGGAADAGDDADELVMGLSEPVSAAAMPALALIVELVATLRAQHEASCTS